MIGWRQRNAGATTKVQPLSWLDFPHCPAGRMRNGEIRKAEMNRTSISTITATAYHSSFAGSALRGGIEAASQRRVQVTREEQHRKKQGRIHGMRCP